MIQIGSFNAQIYPKSGHQEGGARLFMVVVSSRIRSKGHRLEQRRFHLNMRKNFSTLGLTEHYNRLPKEVLESPSLEILISCLNVIVCNLLWENLF